MPAKNTHNVLRKARATKGFTLLGIILLLDLQSLLFSCNTGASAQEQEEKEDATAMEEYQAQEHRFEIRECRLYYNEQQVVLDSLETFERIFGDRYASVGSRQKYYTEKPVEFYLKHCYDENGNIRRCIERLNILMSHDVDYDMSDEFDSVQSLRPVLKGYILFDSVLVDANTRIEDLNRRLEEKGKFTLAPFLGNQASPGLAYDGAACMPSPNCEYPCMTHVSFYYYEDYITKEPTTIQTFRYEY